MLAGIGADTSRILLVNTCTSTHSEATCLIAWVGAEERRRGDSSATVGVISGPYHMRRISIELWQHATDPNLRFFFLPVPFDYYNHTLETYKNWWHSPAMRHLIFFELKKIVHAGFVHHGLCKPKG